MIVDRIIKGVESHPRSFVKAVTWRMMGSIDTFVLSYLFTRNVKAAGAIASTEIITKIGLYYVHERLWSLSDWGHRRERGDRETTSVKNGY